MLQKLVIKTKSVEYMPLSLSVASFANGVAWTIYALLPFDPYILVISFSYFSTQTQYSTNSSWFKLISVCIVLSLAW